MAWTRSMDDQDALDEPRAEKKCTTCHEYHPGASSECHQCYQDAFTDYLQEQNQEREHEL